MTFLTTVERATVRDLAQPALTVECNTVGNVMAEASTIIARLDQMLMRTSAPEWHRTQVALPDAPWLARKPDKAKFWIVYKRPKINQSKVVLAYRMYHNGKWMWGSRLEHPRVTIPDYLVTHWMPVTEPQPPQ